MTFTNEVIARVKDEALNLEGMHTSYVEYVNAMNELIAYFTECKEMAIANKD